MFCLYKLLLIGSPLQRLQHKIHNSIHTVVRYAISYCAMNMQTKCIQTPIRAIYLKVNLSITACKTALTNDPQRARFDSLPDSQQMIRNTFTALLIKPFCHAQIYAMLHRITNSKQENQSAPQNQRPPGLLLPVSSRCSSPASVTGTPSSSSSQLLAGTETQLAFP